MSTQNIGIIPHCILKLNIACKCQGCEKKIKKALLKTQGVVEVKIGLEEGKVRVVGDVDPNELVKNLKKHSGKHAEICSVSKGRNHIAKKNDNAEGRKSSKGCFLGSFYFGFVEKSSKNGGVVAETSKNNSNSIENHYNNNNGNNYDISTTRHHGGEGINGNMGQMVCSNGSMQMQPSSYEQQQYMTMMNQQQGNMNMYPSTMINYMPLPQQMLSHPNYVAIPTHNENAEGCWIM